MKLPLKTETQVIDKLSEYLKTAVSLQARSEMPEALVCFAELKAYAVAVKLLTGNMYGYRVINSDYDGSEYGYALTKNGITVRVLKRGRLSVQDGGGTVYLWEPVITSRLDAFSKKKNDKA